MRLADPLPGFCSVCFGAHPDRRYVDMQADYDGAPVLDRETNTIAVLPWNGQLGGHDNMYVCENCVRDSAELIAFKPELHQRQLAEIRRQEERIGYWRERAHRAESELESRDRYIAQLERQVGELVPRAPGRPRKQVAA